jgi:Ni/Fe-hydrogenase subunit HybB-like protein
MIEIKQSCFILLGFMLLFSGLIDHLLLAFAYRDFSWGLIGMFIFAPLGIASGYYLLQRAVKVMINREKI